MQFNDSNMTTATEALIDTEWFLQYVNETKQPLIHFWQTEPTVILGMKDHRLPNLSQGLNFIESNDFQTVLRSSGGLAVVSDPGIINISLFIPQQSSTISIDDAYEFMKQWTEKALNCTIQTGEITHSYCPGTYDLSVGQQKIAGMSQRRFQDGIVVMMYLGVNGNQVDRSKLVQTFYQQSQAGEDFPEVHLDSMTTLEALHHPLTTISEVKKAFLACVPELSADDDLQQWTQSEAARHQLEKLQQRFQMRQRLLKEE